jgi:Sigma 54 modulation protein / S30EA ribosomal protein
MILRVTTIILLVSSLHAYSVLPNKVARPVSARFATDAGQETVPIILNGQNIDLTPALEEYVSKRIGGILRKLASSGSVRECDVVLSVNRNPKVSC